MKFFAKMQCSAKAISPVISVLLMIAIAVVASLVAYSWVMGFVDFNTSKTGKVIQIQSIAETTTNTLCIYVQNVGDSDVAFDPAGSVYVEDQLQILQTTDFSQTTLRYGETAYIETQYPVPGDDAALKVKVVTKDGTFTQTTDS